MDVKQPTDNSACSGVASVITSGNHTPGVSPNSMQQSNDNQWFLMRVSYGREKRVYDYLIEQGISVFYPTCEKVYEIGGKRKTRRDSLIPNMLFVFSSEESLKNYVGKDPYPYFHHFYCPHLDSKGQSIGSGKKPIIIPDSQMESFIQWYNVESEDKLMSSSSFQFKADDLVRVADGPFAGFEGHVIRYKGQTRVCVNIDAVGFIATAYIPKAYLIKIEQ